MATPSVNVLLTSFPGLNLPKTLTFRVARDAPVTDLTDHVSSLLPSSINLNTHELVLTTTSNYRLSPRSTGTVASLLSQDADLLPLRLTVPLCGGKGGFGSQLRAAGGRMSSKKKAAGENNGSSRNLDGRRLRTVTEAKNLAEYLTIKPEMEKKEKEERRKRWEQVVEAAERKQEEIKSGGGVKGKGKIDGQWVEDKEEMAERAREAVAKAMQRGNWTDNMSGTVEVGGSSSSASAGSASASNAASEDSEEEVAAAAKTKAAAPRQFFGWDDDDEFMSDSDEEADQEDSSSKGKGKAPA